MRQSDPARFFPRIPVARRNLCNLGWFAQIEEAATADGHDVVFTGGTGNMTISWDGRLSLAMLLRNGRLLRLLTEAEAVARSAARSLPRVLASEAIIPLLPPAAQRMVSRILRRAVDDINAFSLLRPEIIDELNLRRQWHADGFDPSYRVRGSSARLRAHQIFDQLQLSRDIAGMQFDVGGFDTRNPFCDRDLVDFCLSVPETLYRRNGIRRWFARQVFGDRLPREILSEIRSGEQAPNWFESLDARKSIIAAEVERLESSHLASRLIDIPRVKRLIAEWPKNARSAQARFKEYRNALDRAVHVGQFIRWVEGGNA